mmetsp:Transcript_2648/g.3258  ORF Transcript_2648/g.3258 Transcript_2648/m.3258 type:complete len:85 (+) Transcript_2648:682-936(+)
MLIKGDLVGCEDLLLSAALLTLEGLPCTLIRCDALTSSVAVRVWIGPIVGISPSSVPTAILMAQSLQFSFVFLHLGFLLREARL